MNRSVLEIGRKMDALGLWSRIAPYNWAVKPRGTVFPYFCCVLPGDRKPVKVRFLMLEGWQTLHDFIRTRVDLNFGVYSSPIEFPHFELVVLDSGEMKVFRHDAGYMPREISAQQEAFVARIMWEAYGVMLRLESEPKLPIRYVADKAMFARYEVSDGVWEDRPLKIPDPPAYVEKISFDKTDLARAKDIPFLRSRVMNVDFRLVPTIMTKEPRPRSVYQLIGYVQDEDLVVFDRRASVSVDTGLKGLWEGMPRQFLKAMIESGSVPGEIRVPSGRVFRMLRPLGLELPFKLVLRDKLKFPSV